MKNQPLHIRPDVELRARMGRGPVRALLQTKASQTTTLTKSTANPASTPPNPST